MIPPSHVLVIVVTAFVASAVGAITGSTSLLTVPVMLLCGMDAKTAVATNMVGVLCLSLGATVPYARERRIPRHPTWGLALGAIPGSLVGAGAAVAISDQALRALITAALLAMSVVVLVRPSFGKEPRSRSHTTHAFGYTTMALWAVYGGLFSGGYATVLTLACVAFFGLTLVDAVGVTKVVNVAGSLAAIGLFAAERRIDWTIAAAIGAASLVGGWLGARMAIERGTAWIRRLFALVVIVLGAKLLCGLV